MENIFSKKKTSGVGEGSGGLLDVHDRQMIDRAPRKPTTLILVPLRNRLCVVESPSSSSTGSCSGGTDSFFPAKTQRHSCPPFVYPYRALRPNAEIVQLNLFRTASMLVRTQLLGNSRTFAENLVGLGFLSSAFLDQTNPNPRKISCRGKKWLKCHF